MDNENTFIPHVYINMKKKYEFLVNSQCFT